MNNIPPDIQEKIAEKYPVRYNSPIFPMKKREAATFGYTLAAQQLEEKEKEIDGLKITLNNTNEVVENMAAQRQTLAEQNQRVYDKLWNENEDNKKMLALTESQRQQWADMCIKKQARIEELETALKQWQKWDAEKNARIKSLEDGLRDLMDAVPKQTVDIDWWEDNLTQSFNHCKQLLNSLPLSSGTGL